MTFDFKLPALSIQQPWAWLIVSGYKAIENRTWATKQRGHFLIHAGKKIDRDAILWIKREFPHIKLPNTFETGGIVGVANLVACVEPKDSSLLTSRDQPWHNSGCHAFVMEDAKSLPFIPMRGMLGFFKPKYEAHHG